MFSTDIHDRYYYYHLLSFFLVFIRVKWHWIKLESGNWIKSVNWWTPRWSRPIPHLHVYVYWVAEVESEHPDNVMKTRSGLSIRKFPSTFSSCSKEVNSSGSKSRGGSSSNLAGSANQPSTGVNHVSSCFVLPKLSCKCLLSARSNRITITPSHQYINAWDTNPRYNITSSLTLVISRGIECTAYSGW
mgnify:CR=1 FL=1